ncbi:hypothetical protein Vretimale_10320 [Volvox reticuliferus]|uniref:Uncharacterized protein n=1 Tax=Volvox reticuliferus TaxID=1737510 RepID=A0A8J4GF97_9CHLO|nr:hypothetical protein Vretimale_10320 [Volvox reticuliferus]
MLVNMQAASAKVEPFPVASEPAGTNAATIASTTTSTAATPSIVTTTRDGRANDSPATAGCGHWLQSFKIQPLKPALKSTDGGMPPKVYAASSVNTTTAPITDQATSRSETTRPPRASQSCPGATSTSYNHRRAFHSRSSAHGTTKNIDGASGNNGSRRPMTSKPSSCTGNRIGVGNGGKTCFSDLGANNLHNNNELDIGGGGREEQEYDALMAANISETGECCGFPSECGCDPYTDPYDDVDVDDDDDDAEPDGLSRATGAPTAAYAAASAARLQGGGSVTSTAAASGGPSRSAKSNGRSWSFRVMTDLHLAPDRHGRLRLPSILMFTHRRPPRHARTEAWWTKIRGVLIDTGRSMTQSLGYRSRRRVQDGDTEVNGSAVVGGGSNCGYVGGNNSGCGTLEAEDCVEDGGDDGTAMNGAQTDPPLGWFQSSLLKSQSCSSIDDNGGSGGGGSGGASRKFAAVEQASGTRSEVGTTTTDSPVRGPVVAEAGLSAATSSVGLLPGAVTSGESGPDLKSRSFGLASTAAHGDNGGSSRRHDTATRPVGGSAAPMYCEPAPLPPVGGSSSCCDCGSCSGRVSNNSCSRRNSNSSNGGASRGAASRHTIYEDGGYSGGGGGSAAAAAASTTSDCYNLAVDIFSKQLPPLGLAFTASEYDEAPAAPAALTPTQDVCNDSILHVVNADDDAAASAEAADQQSPLYSPRLLHGDNAENIASGATGLKSSFHRRDFGTTPGVSLAAAAGAGAEDIPSPMSSTYLLYSNSNAGIGAAPAPAAAPRASSRVDGRASSRDHTAGGPSLPPLPPLLPPLPFRHEPRPRTPPAGKSR